METDMRGPGSTPDPLLSLAQEWECEAEVKAGHGDMYGASLCRMHAAELRGLARELMANATCKYNEAPALTGYSLGGLQNMGLENVGTRTEGRFRIADLPFKAGHGSPTKTILAGKALRKQRKHWARRQRPSASERRARARARREQ